jgi:beta-glucosidase
LEVGAMRRKWLPVIILTFLNGALTFAQSPPANAQPSTDQKPPYLDPALPIERRADDLLSRMTLEEKAAQMQSDAPGIPRLGIPPYNWWNEALHGVARAGEATVFPQAIRLTFWSPNINIFRDPRWGRGQETYGEDPFLTARMGVAFVTGMQGDDSRYLKTVSTPKHYAVHSGPEVLRHRFDVPVTPRDFAETYAPAFRATFVEAKADSVMCAYNRVRGVPACASPLLYDMLRNKWGFVGYAVSDCGAVYDITHGHNFVTTPEEAVALAVKAGTDLTCGTEYRVLPSAVRNQLLTMADVDRAVGRLFTARFRLGMFDPPEMVPWSKLTLADNDSPEHRQLALQAARESIVLLKNNHEALPLKSGVKTIAVIGPAADSLDVLLGNYNGTPSRYTTILAGLRARFPNAKIISAPGAAFTETYAVPIPSAFLRTGEAGSPLGLKAEYFNNRELSGAPLVERVDSQVDFVWDRQPPAPGFDNLSFSARWTGELLPSTDGDYRLGIDGAGGFRLSLDGTLIVDEWSRPGGKSATVVFTLQSGRAYRIVLEYFAAGARPEARLVWNAPGMSAEAVEIAKNADVVIAVAGITPDLEGEEGDVNSPGFFGGDRVDIDLPRPQQELLEAVAAAGKPLIVVLTSGSALSVNWAQEHANAILEAWYPGEEGGAAVSDVLAGDYNPAGRLPVTFYASVAQLPPFTDYSMRGRTYRYFQGTPLYPFGFGLSYTSFAYSNAHVDHAQVAAGEPVTVSADVQNTGRFAGDEVIEVYVTHPDMRGSPLRSLAGFARVRLDRGERKTVSMKIDPRELSVVDESGKRRVVAGPIEIWIGGGQPVAGRGQAPQPGAKVEFRITGELDLPD